MPDHLDFTIYALVDPRAPTVWRYIGATYQKLNYRLCGHISEARNWKKKEMKPRIAWIKSLISDGVKPLIIELDKCDCFEVEKREQDWIDLAKESGQLTNNTTVKSSYTGQYYGSLRLDHEKVVEELQRREAKALQIKNWPLTTKTKLTAIQKKLSEL